MPSSSPPTTPTSTPTSAAVAAPPTHYENFPVASWLCPPRLRPPIAAIYHFARTADDLADEGDATPEARLADMRAYQEDLSAVLEGGQPSPRWAAVFVPLRNAIATFCLPGDQLAALLEAFTEDLVRDAACQSGDAEGAAWRDRDALLGYCSRSANPVGRLLLHLYGVTDAQSLAQSDAICSALQLINFWQDPSVDLPRGRFYFALSDCLRHGLSRADFASFRPLSPEAPPAAAIALVADSAGWARTLMAQGAPLVHRLPGRAGWELRLVVQGGLRILDKIEALGFDTFSQRPTIGKSDIPVLAWRALRMRRQSPA